MGGRIVARGQDVEHADAAASLGRVLVEGRALGQAAAGDGQHHHVVGMARGGQLAGGRVGPGLAEALGPLAADRALAQLQQFLAHAGVFQLQRADIALQSGRGLGNQLIIIEVLSQAVPWIAVGHNTSRKSWQRRQRRATIPPRRAVVNLGARQQGSVSLTIRPSGLK
jgi:hypothetical protein